MPNKTPEGYCTVTQMKEILGIKHYLFMEIFNENIHKFDYLKLSGKFMFYAIKDVPLWQSILNDQDLRVFNRIESYKLDDDQYKVLLKECNECPTSEEILNKEQLVNKINRK